MTLRFLHLADLHLDSPFAGLEQSMGLLPPRFAQASLAALTRAVDFAIQERVDAVLVAGDLYDRRDRSLRARLHWLGALERLHAAGIATFVAHGNHDPYEPVSAKAWPSSVHTFGPTHEEKVHQLPDGRTFRVQGVSFPQAAVTENLAVQFSRRGSEPTIGLLHCNVGRESGHRDYAPCTVDDLSAARLDYWALGHVHGARQYPLASGGLAAYPGNLQGRHALEPGPRGGLLVTLADGARPIATPVAFDTVRWLVRDVAIDGLTSVEAVAQALAQDASSVVAAEPDPERAFVLRFELTGSAPIVAALKPSVLSELEYGLTEKAQRFVVESVQLRAELPLPLDRLAEGGGLVAELVPWAKGALLQPRVEALGARTELESLVEALGRLRLDTEFLSSPEVIAEAARRAVRLLVEDPP